MPSMFSPLYHLRCVAEKPAPYTRTAHWWRRSLDIRFYSFFVDHNTHSSFATVNGHTITIGDHPNLFAAGFDPFKNDINYAVYTTICGFYIFEHGGIKDKAAAKAYLRETTPFILDPEPNHPNRRWDLLLKQHHIGFDRLTDEGIKFRIIDNYPNATNNPDPIKFKHAVDLWDMRKQIAEFETERHHLPYPLPYDAAIHPSHVLEYMPR